MNIADTLQIQSLQLSRRLKFNRKDIDDLAVFAAESLNMPLTVVSLPGYEKRYLTDALKDDLPIKDTDTQFCRCVENEGEPIIIADLREDERFAGKMSLSLNSPFRFFAGAPVASSDGTILGCLAFFDTKPRALSNKQKRVLTVLAAQIARLVEADTNSHLFRRQQAELKGLKEDLNSCERKLKAFFKSSAFCHMLIGKDMEVLDYNKAAAGFVKDMCDKQLQVGKLVLQYIPPQHKADFMVCITKAFSGRSIHKEILINFDKKHPAWWTIYLGNVKNDEGKVVGVVFNACDINDQKQRIAEIVAKNELLADIAYVQSHEYRRPVASILGLMEVLKMQGQPLSEELQMMEVAVNELDRQIRRVISYTQTLSSTE